MEDDEKKLASLIERTFPGWYVTKPIGNGTFGRVFRIEKAGLASGACAVKVIIPSENTLDLSSAFRREEEIAAKLRSVSAVVRTDEYVLDRESGCGLIRMELLDPVKPGDCFSESELLRMGFDVCTALEACAAFHVVHRDIKPGNIFSDGSGGFKLGDFGTARFLSAFVMTPKVGTYSYMSPECYHGGESDCRMDLYSLGVVLYRYANGGRLPFCSAEKQLLSKEEYESAVIRRLEGEPIPPPAKASPAFAAVIRKATAFRPEERYQTASEMKRDLAALLFALPDPASLLPKRKVRRERFAAGFCLAAAVLGIAFGFHGIAMERRYARLIEQQGEPQEFQETRELPEPQELQEPQESAAPVSAPAGEDSGGSDAANAAMYTYEFAPETNTYSITGVLDEKIEKLILPGEVDGIPVTSVASGALRHLDQARELYIPAEITEIFSHDSEKAALSHLPAMKRVTVDENNPVYYSAGNCIIERDSGILVRGYAYSRIPNDGSILTIGDAAFSGVDIPMIALPESVVSTGVDSFSNTGAKKLILPSSLLRWSEHSFNFSKKILEIIVSPDNPYLYVQDGCLIDRNEKTVLLAVPGCVIPDDGSVTALNCFAFANSDDGELVIPDAVSCVWESCFTASKFTSIRMPAGETILRRCVFEDAVHLRTVYLPAGITEIREYAFHHCAALKEVYFAGSRAEWERIAIDDNKNEPLRKASIYVTEGGEYIKYEEN